MKSLCSALLVSSILATVGSAPDARSQTDWSPVSDPNEVRQLVNGRAIDGKYWLHYYREDGNMAFFHVDTDAMSVRKWNIKNDGRLCVAVFQKPDRVIDCFTILRKEGAETEYRLKWGSGINAFELLDEPPENMKAAINETAGPEQ